MERRNSHAKRQVVVVTGATAGVGRAIVRSFAGERARIGLLARGRDGLEATRREVEEMGAEAFVLPTDVADAEQVEEAASAVEDKFGPVDVWVNNAMATVLSRFVDISPTDFRRVTDVCYHGYVYGTMSALRRMVPRDRGTVIQVGSALAYRAIPLQSAYCGAKHAIRGFTDSIRAELLNDGSRVQISMVQLPGLNTPQFRWAKSHMPRKAKPVPPVFQPEVAAEAVVWAAKHHPREMTVGLNSAIVIQGQKLAPHLADRYLALTGIEDQMTEEPEDPQRRDNLWEPVPHDHGAHGVFDDEAKSVSYQLKMRKHRGWIAAGLLASTAGVAAWLTRSRGTR